MISNKKNNYANIEKIFPYLMETIDDLIIIASSDNLFKIEQIYECKFLDQLGYSKDKLLGKSLLNLIYFGDGVTENGFIEKMSQEKSKQLIQIIKKNRNNIWTELRSKRFREENERQKVILKLRNISEMKDLEVKIKASENLGESEEKYRLIYENTTDLISVFNEKFEYKYNNEPRHQQVLGYSNEELLVVHPLTIIHPEDRKRTAINVSRILRKGEGSFQVRIKHKDGSYRSLEMSAKSFINSRGKKSIVSIGRDITNRKMIEEKIRESEEKYRTITDQSILGITILQDDVIKYINHKGADLIGYTVDEIRNWSPNEYAMSIHPEDRQLVIEQARKKQLRDPKVINHYQFRCLKKTGETIWIDNYSKTIDYEGQPADLVTAIDITEMKKAQQALKGSEEKYRHLYESSPYAILLINMEGKIIDCNLTSERLSGFSRNELIGMSFANTSFIPKEFIYTALKDFKTLFKNKVIEPREIQLYTKEKKLIWVLYQASIFSIENQKIIQVMIENINERKIAQEKLQESEAKYHELFETSPDGVILTDLQGIILECNSAIEPITGYSPTEFIGKNFRNLSIYSRNGLQTLLKGYKDLLSEKRLEAVEFPIKTQQNKINWVQVQSTLVNMKGKTYILAVIHDISSLKQAENALKESEKKFRDILETSSVGVMELDIFDKQLLYINPKLLKMIGYDKNELNEEIIRKVIHPKDLIKLLKSNEEAELEFRVTDKQGKLKWLAGKRIPHYNQKGEVNSIRVWLDDITEKKMYENLIYELNINFLNFTTDIRKNIDLLLETCLKLLDGNIILYVHKNISDEKENYQIITSENKVYNYSSEEFHQLFIGAFFHEEHDFPQTFFDIDRMRYAKSDPFIIEHKFKGSFGKVIKSQEGLNSAVCIFYKNNPIISGQDKLVLFLICDAIEIEQRRWRVQQDLEKQNIMLGKINKLKSELFSRTSHELKTPLISVKGFTELLLTLYRSKLDPEIISILEEIKDGGKRLEKIINLLLDSTKLEAGQLSLNLKDEDLTFLIKFCVKELQGLVKLREQSISVNLHNKLETKFDKERIYEVISNLLVNAIKYTPPGGNITIESKKRVGFYEVSIKDNGIGFIEEEKNQVFKQFGKIERYGQGWDIAADGTGLGLYITKKLVELHGGQIWFDSEGRNKGTTFHFTIPIKK